jgi:uncharacterized protein YqeY
MVILMLISLILAYVLIVGKILEMLIDRLKSEIEYATRYKDRMLSSLLKIVLGDCQTKNKFDDDFIELTCRKLIESNLETIKLGGESTQLNIENVILNKYVKKDLSEAELQIHTDKLSIEITDAKSEGQAVGVLMKYLRSIDLRTSGDAAKSVVKAIREGVST